MTKSDFISTNMPNVITLGRCMSDHSKQMITLTEDTSAVAGCNNAKRSLES
jgi:hypothetical protein